MAIPLRLTGKKIEVLVCSKDSENINIKMDDDALKQVPKFKCLGSIFREDGKNKENTIQRIKDAKSLFNNKSKYTVRVTLIWK